MKELIIPSKLNEGDTVAFISISGGRAGDEDMLPRYLLGKRRFEKITKGCTITNDNGSYTLTIPAKYVENSYCYQKSGPTEPHSIQNLPVLVAPHMGHFHPSFSAGFSSV